MAARLETEERLRKHEAEEKAVLAGIESLRDPESDYEKEEEQKRMDMLVEFEEKMREDREKQKKQIERMRVAFKSQMDSLILGGGPGGCGIRDAVSMSTDSAPNPPELMLLTGPFAHHYGGKEEIPLRIVKESIHNKVAALRSVIYHPGSVDLETISKALSALMVDLYVCRFQCATRNSPTMALHGYNHKYMCSACDELMGGLEFAMGTLSMFLVKLMETGQVNAIYYHNAFAHLYSRDAYPKDGYYQYDLPFAFTAPMKAKRDECAIDTRYTAVRVQALVESSGAIEFQHMAAPENPFTSTGIKDDLARDKILWVDRYAIPLVAEEEYDLVGFRYPTWVWPRSCDNPYLVPTQFRGDLCDTDEDLPDLVEAETCEDAD
jgi:hypothetical protein